MNSTPLPYIQRTQEDRLREFLRDGLRPRSGRPAALVLCGREGAGKSTLLRRVFASDPAFRAFRLNAQTAAIVPPPTGWGVRSIADKVAALAPTALGTANPLLGLVAEAALLLGADRLVDASPSDLPLDYAMLERIEDPILVVVPSMDATNVEGLENAACLIREAAVRRTPLTLIFLDEAPIPPAADPNRDGDARAESRVGSGLRRFLEDDRHLEELVLPPIEEAQILESFAALGLTAAWAATFFHLSDGHPAAMTAWWEALQSRGLLRRDGERWKAESPATAGTAWGVVRDRLLDLLRPRMTGGRQHEPRLITALHLAAAMGDTFLPKAVSDAVLAADPKLDEIDADAWEDHWYDVLEHEDGDHSALAAAVVVDGAPVELQADDRRLFVYRFRDVTIVHLLRAAMKKLWQRDGGAADPPDSLSEAADALEFWLNDVFRVSWRDALPYRAALLRVQNRHRDASAFDDLHHAHRLAASLTERVARERARAQAGSDAGELYGLLSWAAGVWNTVGEYQSGANCITECYHLWHAGRKKISRTGEIALFNQLACSLANVGRPAEAEPFFRRALEAAERVCGPEHHITLALVGNMGFLLNSLGRPAEAEPYYRRALDRRERVLGPEHPDTLSSVSNMGFLLDTLGRPAEAEPHFRRALEGRERLLGPEHPDTLSSVSSIGFLLGSLGRPSEAEPYYRRALEARERLLGPEHPDTLSSVNDTGSLLDTLGRSAEAEPYYRRALEARERLLGPDHPDTLTSVNNMGSLLDTLGRSAEAEPYYRRALEGYERVLGPEHPDTLSLVSNMGFLLDTLGRSAEAEPHFRRALEVRERLLGPEHPDTLMSLNNMGALLNKVGRPAEAEPYHRRALEGRERLLGPEHPDTLTSVSNMGFLLDALGRPDKAEPYIRRALEGRERVLGPEHPDTLSSVNNMGALLYVLGRPAEAEPYCRRALNGRERVLGPEHPDTLSSVSNMGTLLDALGRPAEAEPYIRRALEGRERLLGPEHPDTLTLVSNMGFLLDGLGRPDEAKPYLRRALEVQERVLGPEQPDT